MGGSELSVLPVGRGAVEPAEGAPEGIILGFVLFLFLASLFGDSTSRAPSSVSYPSNDSHHMEQEVLAYHHWKLETYHTPVSFSIDIRGGYTATGDSECRPRAHG